MDDSDLPELLSTPIQYRDDLYRNIKTCREAQDLYADLTDNPDEFEVAFKVEALTRPSSLDPTVTRAFDDVVDYPFSNLTVTRFSDGSYGVFYGALNLDTTVSETIYHWLCFLNDSDFLIHEIIGERRVYLVHADATLFDCTDKWIEFPELIDPNDYTSTHMIGAYLREQDRDGLLTKSARCDGLNAPIFRQDRLSNWRIHCHLTYKLIPSERLVLVERQLGTTYDELAWEDVGFDAQ